MRKAELEKTIGSKTVKKNAKTPSKSYPTVTLRMQVLYESTDTSVLLVDATAKARKIITDLLSSYASTYGVPLMSISMDDRGVVTMIVAGKTVDTMFKEVVEDFDDDGNYPVMYKGKRRLVEGRWLKSKS